jgi:hypothetical protein
MQSVNRHCRNHRCNYYDRRFAHKHHTMPTEFIVRKWLCDSCPQLCDSEPECHVHARQMHKHTTSDLLILEQICVRFENETNSSQFQEFEILCNILLAKVAKRKATVTGIRTTEAEQQPSALMEVLPKHAHPLPTQQPSNVAKIECCIQTNEMTSAPGPDRSQFDQPEAENTRSSVNTQQQFIDAADEMIANDEMIVDKYMKDVHDNRREQDCESRKRTVSRPFACDVDGCDRRYSAKGSVQAHKRHDHEQTTPMYQCEHCVRAFTRAAHLRMHRLVHTGERPYACTSCTRRFQRNGHLRDHYRAAHTLDRPHVCTHCRRTFPTSSQMHSHRRRDHPTL